LFEELLVGDNVVGTIHPMIMRAEEQMIPWKQLAPAVSVLDQACRNFDYEKVRATLLETVEGYSPQCNIIDPVWKSMEEKIGKEARKTPMRLLFKKI
jgi:FlaA1/EpsC-like NDP-sugar epimerase